MSATIYTVIAKANISENELKALIRSEGIAIPGTRTYDAERLFDAISRRYGWVPADEQDNCCCLWDSERQEACRIPLPCGPSVDCVVQQWEETDGETHCEALMLYIEEPGNGLFVNRYRRQGRTLEVGILHAEEMSNLWDTQRYLYGYQKVRLSDLDPDEKALVKNLSKGFRGRINITRTVAVPVEAVTVAKACPVNA